MSDSSFNKLALTKAILTVVVIVGAFAGAIFGIVVAPKATLITLGCIVGGLIVFFILFACVIGLYDFYDTQER